MKWEIGEVPPGWTKGATLEIWNAAPHDAGRVQLQTKDVGSEHPQAYYFDHEDVPQVQAWLDWWIADERTHAQRALEMADRNMIEITRQIAKMQPGDQAQLAGLAQQMLDIMELAGGHAPMLLSYVSCSFAKLYATVLAHGATDTHDDAFVAKVKNGKVPGMSMQGDVLTLDANLVQPDEKPKLIVPPDLKVVH